ncbi:hypothetical protein Tco_1155774 [Tanacetum coccineum]
MEICVPQLSTAKPNFSQPDSSLVCSSVPEKDDPIMAINQMMSILNCCVTSGLSYAKAEYKAQEEKEQGLVIAALKNELRKLKGKAIDKEAIETHSVDPNMSKDNMEPTRPNC